MSSPQPTLTATNKLKTNPNNPRAIRKDQLDKLVKSLREFPEMLEARPIVVNPDYVVLGGNMRLKAAMQAGLKEVPVYVASWDEAKNKEFIIKDNLAFGEWDWDMLANEWEADELNDWGLEVPMLEDETEGLTDPDDVPEVPEEPKTKAGDLWILGDHRLLCGDSTKAEDVEKLMNGEKADIVFTDPPYGMRLDCDYSKMPRGKNTYDNVIGDHQDFDPACIFQVDSPVYMIWGADWFYSKLQNGFSPIVWDKQPFEVVAGPQNHFELCWVKPKKKRTIIRHLWTGFTAKEKNTKRVHPTQKPMEVTMQLLGIFEGNIVVDLFGGSGSTLIACEKTSRHCRMMELDPKYCDVIVKRWEDFTGKKAELWKQ